MKKKQHVISFCGPDGCGKTSIAHALGRTIDVPYFKASDEREAFANDQNKFLYNLQYASPAVIDVITQTKTSIIMDRNYPCEYAYSKLYNRSSDNQSIEFLDKRYASLGHRIIFCVRKDYSCVSDDLDITLTGDKLKTLESYYDEYFNTMTHCQVLKLYVDDFDIHKQILEITKFLNVWEG